MAEKSKPKTGLEWLNQNYGPAAFAQIGDLITGAAGDFGRAAERRINQLGGYETPSGLTAEQQKSLIEGPEGAAARVARIKSESDELVDAARKDPTHQYHNLFRQPPAQNIEPIVDRRNARTEVYNQMMQQYGGSTPGEAFDNAPRSNQVGYMDRPDIQAWMKAHAGTKMVENFQAKQRAKGLVDETSTEFGGVRLTQPKGNSLEDKETREQGAMENPVTGKTFIEEAQKSVNKVNTQEMLDVLRGEAQIEGLEFGNLLGGSPGMPGRNNRLSMLYKGEQAVKEQAKKTEAAIPLWDKSMQPYSALSDIGVEPSQIWNMANKGELPKYEFGYGLKAANYYLGK